MLVDVNPSHPRGLRVPTNEIEFAEFVMAGDDCRQVVVMMLDGTEIASQSCQQWPHVEELRRWLIACDVMYVYSHAYH
jgi:hypothetical protein